MFMQQFFNFGPIYYLQIKLFTILSMQDAPQATIKKKSPERITTFKSPYFGTVHRNQNVSKYRMSAQNAITITKYPTTNDEQTFFIQNTGQLPKKKVFKRFNRFEQIDQLYNADYPTYGTIVKQNNDKMVVKQAKQLINSNPKDIIYSSKTISLVEKYNSYKSIMPNRKNIGQSEQKIKKNNNFRTKTKSGHTINLMKHNISQRVANKYQDQLKIRQRNQQNKDRVSYNQDWLCQQLIQSQVYGMRQDDLF